jgi:virginiamycin B lyase
MPTRSPLALLFGLLGLVSCAVGCDHDDRRFVTEFPLPSPISGPMGIVAGPDGSLWFAESSGWAIGRMSMSGELAEFPVPGGMPSAITVGPDGNLWFTEDQGRIGRITPSGIVAEFLTDYSGLPRAISAGADGNVWFAGISGIPSVGRVSPAGTAETIPLPATVSVESPGMALGADGAIWFTNGKSIIRLTPEGTTTVFGPAVTRGLAQAIVAGLNSDLWFSALAGGVGRITLSGEISESALPANVSAGYGIAVGPDGDVWFTESGANKIGRLSASGTFVEYDIPTAGSFPYGIAVAADGSVWFTEKDVGKIGRIVP